MGPILACRSLVRAHGMSANVWAKLVRNIRSLTFGCDYHWVDELEDHDTPVKSSLDFTPSEKRLALP